MNDIEKAIREKKAEIKKANRELSELQDKLAKSKEPRWYRLDFIDGPHSYAYRYGITVQIESNHPIDKAELKSKIESLSDKPKDDKCYVDWDDPRLNGYSWAAIDNRCNRRICVYTNKPHVDGDQWVPEIGGWKSLGECYTGNMNWQDSLIHRPGVKE